MTTGMEWMRAFFWPPAFLGSVFGGLWEIGQNRKKRHHDPKLRTRREKKRNKSQMLLKADVKMEILQIACTPLLTHVQPSNRAKGQSR